MIVSETCVELVKRFESCCLSSYLCPAAVPTIGYGHTAGVVAGQTISQTDAERMLRQDLNEAARAVSRCVTAALTQPQFDALVSFAFNIGAGAFQSSTMCRMLNQARYEEAAAEFQRWNRVGKKAVAGLTARRVAERALFEGRE